MWIPGFGSEELRPYKKSVTTEAHKQVLVLFVAFWNIKWGTCLSVNLVFLVTRSIQEKLFQTFSLLVELGLMNLRNVLLYTF